MAFAILAGASSFTLSLAEQRDIRIGTSLTEFGDFLSRDSVQARSMPDGFELSPAHFQLVREEKIARGCRRRGADRSLFSSAHRIVAVEIAHDVAACQFLYLVGVPTED